jgi:hypothetical protein
VRDGEIPGQRVEFLDDVDPALADLPVPPSAGTDELTQLRGGGFDPAYDASDDASDDGAPDDDPPDDDPPDDLAGDPAGGLAGGGLADEPADDPQPVRGRSRRGRSRETVPV